MGMDMHDGVELAVPRFAVEAVPAEVLLARVAFHMGAAAVLLDRSFAVRALLRVEALPHLRVCRV